MNKALGVFESAHTEGTRKVTGKTDNDKV